MNKVINVGVAEKLGKYSDAIQTSSGACWLYTSGTPGLYEDGTLPEDFESQARLAW
jgi:enamine deaminase RidA (YjgF/YER057c/UK114 family)